MIDVGNGKEYLSSWDRFTSPTFSSFYAAKEALGYWLVGMGCWDFKVFKNPVTAGVEKYNDGWRCFLDEKNDKE